MREPLSQAGIIMISARDPPNAWLTVEKSGHWDIEVFFSCPRLSIGDLLSLIHSLSE